MLQNKQTHCCCQFLKYSVSFKLQNTDQYEMETTYDWQPISVTKRELYEVKTNIARGLANLWKINSKFSFYEFQRNVYWYSMKIGG